MGWSFGSVGKAFRKVTKQLSDPGRNFLNPVNAIGNVIGGANEGVGMATDGLGLTGGTPKGTTQYDIAAAGGAGQVKEEGGIRSFEEGLQGSFTNARDYGKGGKPQELIEAERVAEENKQRDAAARGRKSTILAGSLLSAPKLSASRKTLLGI